MVNNIKVSTTVLVIFTVFCASCVAGTIYVDAGADGANNGSSWGDAFVELQSGLGAATPGDISN